MRTNRLFLPILLALGLLAAPAAAQGFVSVLGGAGYGTAQEQLGLGWSWHPGLLPDDGHWVSYWEASLARWDGPGSNHLWDAGLTPYLRYQFSGTSGWYAEAGFGVHYLSRHYERSGGRSATLYQFGSVLAAGYRFAGGSDVALRAAHISNAGLREPNPGISFVQLRYQYWF